MRYFVVDSINNEIYDLVDVEPQNVDTFEYDLLDSFYLIPAEPENEWVDWKYDHVWRYEEGVDIGFKKPWNLAVNGLGLSGEERAELNILDVIRHPVTGMYHFQSKTNQYPSWTKDEHGLWQPPVKRPYDQIDENDPTTDLRWDEDNQQWIPSYVPGDPTS